MKFAVTPFQQSRLKIHEVQMKTPRVAFMSEFSDFSHPYPLPLNLLIKSPIQHFCERVFTDERAAEEQMGCARKFEAGISKTPKNWMLTVVEILKKTN